MASMTPRNSPFSPPSGVLRPENPRPPYRGEGFRGGDLRGGRLVAADLFAPGKGRTDPREGASKVHRIPTENRLVRFEQPLTHNLSGARGSRCGAKSGPAPRNPKGFVYTAKAEEKRTVDMRKGTTR